MCSIAYYKYIPWAALSYSLPLKTIGHICHYYTQPLIIRHISNPMLLLI